MSGLDLLGWIGGGLCAMAYVLVSTRRLVPDGARFQGLNMAGAGLLSVASFNSGALPSAYMNIAWILFGAQSLATASQLRRGTAAGERRVRQEVAREVRPEVTGRTLVDVVRNVP